MQTITTKHLPGYRIKASTTSGVSLTIPYPSELSTEESHWLAAKTLIEKKLPQAWRCDLIQADTTGGYVFAFANDTKRSFQS